MSTEGIEERTEVTGKRWPDDERMNEADGGVEVVDVDESRFAACKGISLVLSACWSQSTHRLQRVTAGEHFNAFARYCLPDHESRRHRNMRGLIRAARRDMRDNNDARLCPRRVRGILPDLYRDPPS
mgnify:CR=1 FL=1